MFLDRSRHITPASVNNRGLVAQPGRALPSQSPSGGWGSNPFVKKPSKKNWKKDFSYYLRTRVNQSEGSVRGNIDHMGQVLRRYPDLTPEDVYRLKERLIIEGKQSTYINKLINACRHWFMMQGLDIPFKRLHEEEKLIDYLTLEELKALFAATDKEPDEHLRLRDRTIMAAAVYSGIRRTEISRLKRYDINLEKQEIRVRKPKNRRPDIAIIPKCALHIWMDWLNFRDNCKEYQGNSDLFLNFKFHRFGFEGVADIPVKYSEIAGIKHTTITLLRHTLGTLMKRNGADVLDIKAQMRHRNIQSTMKYVNMDKEALKAVVDKYVPGF